MGYKIKKVIQIEDHVSKIKIKGFVNFYSGCGREHQPMTIMGSVKKKNFSVRTNGNNTLGEIVKMILEDLK
jgi:hypothetical protein